MGSLVSRIGFRTLLVAGSVLAGTGFAAFALLDHRTSYFSAILPGVVLLGCGMTLCVAPLTTTVMSSVCDGQPGIASAVNNAISRLSGLVAISLIALALSRGFEAALHEQLSASNLPQAARMSVIREEGRMLDIKTPADLSMTQRWLERIGVRQLSCQVRSR